MKLSPIITGLCAIVLTASTLFLAWQFKGGSEAQAESYVQIDKVAVPMTTIVVASRDINEGDEVGLENLMTKDWPETQIPFGAFVDLADIGSSKFPSRKALVSIKAGDPIVDSRLSIAGVRASLSGRLEPSQRAFTILMDDVTGVAGFVLPGDHVDVLVTDNIENGSQSGTYTTNTLVENVEVLAVDRNDDILSDTPKLFSTATLAVNMSQAQKLSTGATNGQLSLVLRSNRATDEDASQTAKPAQEKVKSVAAKAVTKPAPLQTKRAITIVHGDTRMTQNVPVKACSENALDC